VAAVTRITSASRPRTRSDSGSACAIASPGERLTPRRRRKRTEGGLQGRLLGRSNGGCAGSVPRMASCLCNRSKENGALYELPNCWPPSLSFSAYFLLKSLIKPRYRTCSALVRADRPSFHRVDHLAAGRPASTAGLRPHEEPALCDGPQAAIAIRGCGRLCVPEFCGRIRVQERQGVRPIRAHRTEISE